MNDLKRFIILLFAVVCLSPPQHSQEAHNKTLAPVYGPLADYLVERYNLADKEGVALDVGSGHGDLIIELCKRTKLHWINADIDTKPFAGFFQMAKLAGVETQIGALYADVQDLPFKDNYADFICSRGSFPFWDDQEKGFGEVYRVLKPGCYAYIGRGFSPNLPPEVARQVRSRQMKGKAKRVLGYSVDETETKLVEMMKNLKIENYKIFKPPPAGSEGILYGIWIEIYKPES